LYSFRISLDTPGAPSQPEIIDYDRDFVELKWDKPEKDGGSPVTGFIIGISDVSSPFVFFL